MDFSLAGISIQQIIVFLCVAEYEGFAKASDYLHMTQSAVSKSVAKMEKELGIELFQRTTREIQIWKTSCWKESTMRSWCRILNGLHWNEKGWSGKGRHVPMHRL